MGIFIAMGTLGYSLGPLLSSTIAQYFGLNKMPFLAILGIIWALLMFSSVPKFSNTEQPKSDFKLKQAFVEYLIKQKIEYSKYNCNAKITYHNILFNITSILVESSRIFKVPNRFSIIFLFILRRNWFFT